MHTRLNPSPEYPRFHRSILAVSLSLALGACSTLTTESAAPAAAAPAPVAQSSLPAIEDTAAPRQNAAEGINREGRVIQLGRFSEPQPPGNAPSNDVVELNYEQEDLRVVFEQLGDALGINLVIDPSIDFRVSVRTSAANPLRYADIWPLMRALARSAGVTIEQSGNVYQVRRDASRIPTELVLPEFLSQATASEVLQVTPLRYISVEAAEAILTPLLQPEGSVMRLGGGNVLGISGTPQELSRVNALLAVVDDDPFQNQGIRLYELANSSAAEVATELQSVLTLIEGEAPSYQVLGLERVNAVLVVAPANRGFNEVDRWINLLDASSQEQVEQLFVYKVKNLDAVALAQTLNSVFGQQDTTNQPRPRRQAQPFSSPLVPQSQAPEFAPTQQQPVDLFAQPQTNAQNEGAVSADITVTIVADEDTNSLLVRATPREYRQLLGTIGSLDRVPAQVLIHAVIGQVTLTDSTKFGIDWTIVSESLGSGSSNVSTNFLPSFVDDEGEIRPGSGLLFTRNFIEGSAAIEATLNAIAEDNDVRLLSRPTILARNKQEGIFKVGQNIPVNNGTTVTNTGSTQNIAYTDVGIELTITPQINDDGYISLEIQQRLSSVEGTSQIAGNPTFSNQEISTSLVVADQTTIALGGLIQEENNDLQNGVPYLMNIPLAGRLFSYTDNTTRRRELFVILRPQIIYGDARDSAALQAYRENFAKVKELFEDAGL